ncbi:MAG: OmpA family protein [SAR324 cluster bacterium]|nr:OmpA family protein [SAR324 cluster bacterium]
MISTELPGAIFIYRKECFMRNCNFNPVIYLILLVLLLIMNAGCQYTEEEYMARVDEAKKYQILTKRQQAIVNEQKKNIQELQQSLTSEKKRAMAQQEMLSAQNRKLGEMIGDYELKITKFEQQERQLLDETEKKRKQEEELRRQLESYQNESEELQERFQEDHQARQDMVMSLRDQLESAKVKVMELSNRVAVRLDETLLFDSGKSYIKASGFKVLKKIGAVLKKIHDRHIQVEGHTDARRIGGTLKKKFPTNWELSAARAANVVRYLVDEIKIEPNRISASGFGPYQPIADNKTPEGRQSNRRVEFALLPLRTNSME